MRHIDFLDYQPSDKDYPNGGYTSGCVVCGSIFVGHKHCVLCAICCKKGK